MNAVNWIEPSLNHRLLQLSIQLLFLILYVLAMHSVLRSLKTLVLIDLCLHTSCVIFKNGDLPLHILCQNEMLTRDLLRQALQVHPAGVYTLAKVCNIAHLKPHNCVQFYMSITFYVCEWSTPVERTFTASLSLL